YLGHVGVRRNDPDFYKLLVLDHVFGTGTGFTDRLSAKLRDRQGLAYTVSANVTASAEEAPGAFQGFLRTFPDTFAFVRKELLDQLKQIRTARPTAEEVESAKQYLIGNLPFKLKTGDHVCGVLVQVERYGLGFNYLDDYRKAVAAVTPDDVLAAAQ